MNEIKEHLKAYHSELVSIVKKGDFNEHTFRTPLENLLNALKPKDIRLTHEPKAEQGQGSVRPDFKIYKQTPHYEALQGFIECKNYKENLDTLVKGKQIEKYLAVCPNIILTDYNRFILLSFGKIIADITLFPFGLENALFTQEKAKDIEIQNAFIQLLQSFFESVANITNKDELVAILSTQSFYLSETIFKSDEAGLLNTQFKESFEKAFATFASLENTTFSKIEFCDILAQSVVYGMFVAYIENDEFEIDKIPIQSFIQLLPQHFLTLQEFVYYSLPFFALPENIKYALENVKKTIALIDKPSLATSFEKEIQSLSIYLYEDFLKAYDTLRGEQRRKEGGVFYTPQPVVNMIVSSLNELLQSKFDKKGFNDESVKVLDFATGTGSFLAKVFELILANESEVFAKELIINKCLKDIYGFELSFVPYIVAHLKLSSILRQKGFSDLNLTHKFQIFLTNTLDLDGDKQIQMQVPFDSLKGQRDEALKLKRQEDLLVILGNPPYNVKSKNKGDEILKLLQSYKQGLNETNIQPLDDDYIKFIRFAQWKLLEQNQKQGLMGFITNNSFLDGRTHRKMRQSLARAFDEIYILNLHGDSGDENVFDIRVGVCISLFVKYKEIDTSGDSKSPLPCKEQTKNSPSLAEGARGWVKTSNNPSHRPLAPYMKEFSRAMRKNPTQAENKLWQELRGKKLGFGFRRQFVIDSKYIADFVCLEKRLIIECDGGQHATINTPPQTPPARGGAYSTSPSFAEGLTSTHSPSLAEGDKGGGYDINHPDIERNFYLESQNFRILRFWNNEILENLEGVLSVIKEALNDDNFASAKFTHPLTPSAREGEQDKNSIKAPPLAGGVGEGYPYAKVLYYSTNNNGILKRNDKFALLNSIAQNGLNSVKWQELKLDEPYFWFVPKSFENDEYENFWALAGDKALGESKAIFENFSSGVENKRNSISICFNKTDLEQILSDFCELSITEIKSKYGLEENNINVWIEKAKADIRSMFADKNLSLNDKTLKSPLPCGGGLGVGIKTDKSPSHRPLAPYMKEFSRAMRKNPTQAENKLWQELRSKKLGFGFRRQFVIDSKYIADFVCLEKRLIIECDGGQHNQNFDDIERNFYLESQNFRILRFWNNEILENLEGVLSVIKEALNDDNFASAKFTHPLTPSAREGEINPKHKDILKSKIVSLAFHPFDFRYTFYSDKQGFLRRACYETMQHFIKGENLGLCFPKTCLNSNFDYGLIVDTIADRSLGGANSGSETYIAPLYIYRHDKEVDKVEPTPNFTPEFKEFIIKSKVLKDKSAEQILAFIYANLFNPTYRKKYLEYLKIGFPRVNFEVSKSEFETFAKIGQKLIDLHLLKNIPNDESIALKFSDKADKQKPNFTLEKPRFIDDKIILNDDLEIVGVAKSIFEFSIGGYKVLDKWLKYRVGKALSKAELEHLVNVACIIKETIKIQNELENLAQKDKK